MLGIISEGPVIIVRAEEVLLVVLVLTLWVAAIALFFNRWGKIRMLEPYQPKFQQSHRPSCPLAPLSPPGITPQVSTVQRPQKSICVRVTNFFFFLLKHQNTLSQTISTIDELFISVRVETRTT